VGEKCWVAVAVSISFKLVLPGFNKLENLVGAFACNQPIDRECGSRYVRWAAFKMRTLIMLGRISAFISTFFGCSKQGWSGPVAVINNEADHNRCYKQANELTTPYFRLLEGKEKSARTAKAQADLRHGIALYAAVVNYAPTNWNAYWLMGKAYQALKEPTNACEAFGKAYGIQKSNPDVAREYMFECLELGRASEGIAAAEHAVSLEPRNAGLLANLALAYTIAGRTSEALAKVEESLSIDPSDKITSGLKRAIREIIQGKRPQPKKLGDLSSA
jgi:tetratricopeptide (TPR) repeat protein